MLNLKFYLWVVVIIALVLGIYGGIPLSAWWFLHPTVFWQKLAFIICVFFYEGAAVVWGIFFGVGAAAALVD